MTTKPVFTLLPEKRELISRSRYRKAKLDKDLILSFRVADRVKFTYKDNVHKLIFIKTAVQKGDLDTISEYACNGDFRTKEDETPSIDFCEFEIHFANVDWPFQTFVGHMKEGQELELIWEPDTQITRETQKYNLHVDTLLAILYTGIERQHHFILGTHVGSEKEGTRMIMPTLEN